jgi:hypothetical protein
MRLLGIVALALLTASAHGQRRDGNDSEAFLRECASAIRYMDGDTSANMQAANACLMYIAGFRDATTLAESKQVCTPVEATNAQLIRVVAKHLQDNPSTLHLDKAIGVHRALLQAYPCRRK